MWPGSGEGRGRRWQARRRGDTLGAHSEKTMTSDSPEQGARKRTVYLLLICVGYAYILFFFLFMFRTVFFPQYFER